MEQRDLDSLVHGAIGKSDIAGAVLHVRGGSIDLISAAGELQPQSRYYIASINKMFMSALILRLAAQGELALTDPFAAYAPAEVVSGLHVLHGTDYSRAITLRHLISQTSGLPDYLGDPLPGGGIVHEQLRAGQDQAWPLARVVETVKRQQPHFAPGQLRRARYGDTGHQLLQYVVEAITGRSTKQVLADLFDELGMVDTYVATDPGDPGYLPVRYGPAQIPIGKFISSTGNDIISTARDQMAFLRAFFAGAFWPEERLPELQRWLRTEFPFRYGIGIQLFAIPRALTAFRQVPPLIGHAGSPGTVAFYAPDRDLAFTGTVNQEAKPAAIFKLMVKALAKA